MKKSAYGAERLKNSLLGKVEKSYNAKSFFPQISLKGKKIIIIKFEGRMNTYYFEQRTVLPAK